MWEYVLWKVALPKKFQSWSKILQEKVVIFFKSFIMTKSKHFLKYLHYITFIKNQTNLHKESLTWGNPILKQKSSLLGFTQLQSLQNFQPTGDEAARRWENNNYWNGKESHKNLKYFFIIFAAHVSFLCGHDFYNFTLKPASRSTDSVSRPRGVRLPVSCVRADKNWNQSIMWKQYVP